MNDNARTFKNIVDRAAKEAQGFLVVQAGPDTLFSERLPLNPGRQSLNATMSQMQDAIDIHWRATGKKEAKFYYLAVKAADGVGVVKGLLISREPQPTTVEDLVAQAHAVSLQSITKAAETIKVPYEQLKEQNESLQKALDTAHGRVKALEEQCFEYCDRLMSHAEKASEGHVFAAQVEAINRESRAKVEVYQGVSRQIFEMTPRLAALAFRMLGKDKAANILQIMGGKGAPALGPPPTATTPAAPAAPAEKAPKAKEPGKPPVMSEATEGKLRALGATLTGAELSALMKGAWDLDPAGDLLKVLEPAHQQAAFEILAALANEWE